MPNSVLRYCSSREIRHNDWFPLGHVITPALGYFRKGMERERPVLHRSCRSLSPLTIFPMSDPAKALELDASSKYSIIARQAAAPSQPNSTFSLTPQAQVDGKGRLMIGNEFIFPFFSSNSK